MIIFYTYDLFEGRERLMPWRTIIEVCREFQSRYDLKVCIFSIDKNPSNSQRFFQSVAIRSVGGANAFKEKLLKEHGATTIIVPLAFRSRREFFSGISCFKGRKIGYFPGGIYCVGQVLRAIRYIGFRAAMPYIVESLSPKSRAVKFIKKSGIKNVICLTKKTKDTLIKYGAGKEKVLFIPPGKDEVCLSMSPSVTTSKADQFDKEKYFLYMGGPASIRGIEVLLAAIDAACEVRSDLILACFLRVDPSHSDLQIKRAYSKLVNKKNVRIFWEELSTPELFSIVRKARAVVLPFLLIPSEIPLTFFEVMNEGANIITFPNGGSTEFLSEALFIANPTVEGLSQKLIEVWDNDYQCQEKKLAVKKLIANHITWEAVSRRWLSVFNVSE